MGGMSVCLYAFDVGLQCIVDKQQKEVEIVSVAEPL